MDDEAALRLDRAAEVDGRVGRFAGVDVQLLQQIVEAESRHHPPQADAERAFLVMDAHRDHRLLEARIADARHGEQELAAEEPWRIHSAAIGASRDCGQSPRPIRAQMPCYWAGLFRAKESDMTINVGDRIPMRP